MIKSEFEIFLLCAMFCFVVYHGFPYDMLLLFRFVRCLPFCCCCCYCCRRKNERSWMSVCCWNVWFDSLQRRLPLHRGHRGTRWSCLRGEFLLNDVVEWVLRTVWVEKRGKKNFHRKMCFEGTIWPLGLLTFRSFWVLVLGVLEDTCS